MKTLGNSAEVPNRGVSLVAIVKSGSNGFHSSTSLRSDGARLGRQHRRQPARQGHHRWSDPGESYSVSNDLRWTHHQGQTGSTRRAAGRLTDQQPLNAQTRRHAGNRERNWRVSLPKERRTQMSQGQPPDWLLSVQSQSPTAAGPVLYQSVRSGLMTPSRTGKVELITCLEQPVHDPRCRSLEPLSASKLSFAPQNVPPASTW